MAQTEFKGFSIIEMMILLGIFVLLAGIVVPIVSQETRTSMGNRAMNDMNEIASAINLFIGDTLYYPTGEQGSTTYHFLYTKGEIPPGNPFASGPGMPLSELLNSSKYGGPNWNGPYAKTMPRDPWGHAYLVNTHSFFYPAERCVVVSAGPNGVVDTPVTASSPSHDDILLVID